MTRKRIWILCKNKIPFESNHTYSLTLSKDINSEVVQEECGKTFSIRKGSDSQTEYAPWSTIYGKPSKFVYFWSNPKQTGFPWQVQCSRACARCSAQAQATRKVCSGQNRSQSCLAWVSVWAENSDLDTYVWISHIMWLWFTIFHGCREMWHFTDSPEWVNSMNSVRNICFRRSFLILKARRPTSMQGDWLVFLSFYIYKSCTQLPHITCYF